MLKKVAAGRPPGSAAGGGRYQINHFDWWDERFATDVAGLAQRELEARLRAAGAPPTCWVISEDSEIDAASLPVAEALARMWEPWEASIASFVPGRLAYYHDHDDRSYLILERE